MAKCGTRNGYPRAQCTYWADERYHQLTGCYVPWSGDAFQWKSQAKLNGWQVSDTPIVPSIIVLQPGVQGASPVLGHVGIVEQVLSDGSVNTSNLNWAPTPGQVTNVKHTIGAGVSFIWNSDASTVPQGTIPAPASSNASLLSSIPFLPQIVAGASMTVLIGAGLLIAGLGMLIFIVAKELS